VARSVQCPSCGARQAVGGESTGSFRCQRCGQAIGVPARASKSAAPPAPVAPAGGPPAAPPRRRGRVAGTGGDGAGTAVISPDAPPRTVAVSSAAPVGAMAPVAAPPAARGRGATVPRRDDARRRALPRWLRVAAWLVAIPLSLIIVGIPARTAGYLTGQRLGDVVLKHGLDRFVPLVVIVVLSALVCTVLVTILIEGGSRLLARRGATAGN
jgi:hypothetical protein